MKDKIKNLLTPNNSSDLEDENLHLSCPTVQGDSKEKEVSNTISSPVKFGFIVALVVFGFFGLWGFLAPLDSAAIATGSIVLDSNRKTIQHLEGGIITEILVKEGDLVEKNQPLVYLNNTAAKARRELVRGQLITAKATENRLEAERDSGSIEFDPQIMERKDDPEVKKIIDSQLRLFKTRTDAAKGQIDILQQRILQFNEQIEGLEAQKRSALKRMRLTRDEIKTMKPLMKEGLATQSTMMQLEKSEAEIEGVLGEYTAEIARVGESITEAQYQMINVQNEYLKEVITELKETQQNVADLEEQLNASSDVLERTVILSPQAGKITGLKFHTIGGVIGPGEPIMDIVPQNDHLIVEAQVKPQDIDVVHDGSEAKVMLSAYKSRQVPRLEGEVVYVSADRFIDENTGEPYYLTRIEIEEGAVEKLEADVELYPGMPAEVFIQTGESTLIQYLMSPIIDSFRRSLKED